MRRGRGCRQERPDITGADKNVTVSVILSRSDKFVADLAIGWSHASIQKEETPEDAATSQGSDLWESQPALSEGTGTAPG